MFDATVVAASRDWICVRLATYENKLEGDFLTSIFTGRSGLLENTTFALLGPDGSTRLSRAGRGPQHLEGGRRGPPRRGPSGGGSEGVNQEEAAALAGLLKRKAADYRRTRKIEALPQALDLRRALNVAACDNQPLIVAYGKSKATRAAMEKTLATLAWSDAFVGRLQYSVVSEAKDLSILEKHPKSEGIVFVQPDRFGLTGIVRERASPKADAAALTALFHKGLRGFQTFEKDTRDQKRAARREGIEPWESEIPVTDPGRPPGGQDGPPGRGGR